MEDRKTVMLEKVQKLINKADSAEQIGNAAEAQAFRNKADELMALYAIEMFELEMHEPASKRTEHPQMREWDFTDLPDSISATLVELFSALVRYCRCKFGYYSYQRAKVVGYPADLDYLNLLYTSLRMHMSSNISPQPSKELGYLESLALLKEAGNKWQKVYDLMLPIFPERFERGRNDHASNKDLWDRHVALAQQHEGNWQEKSYITQNWRSLNGHYYLREIPRPIGVRFTKEYTEFCRETGRERVYTDPSVWFRNFVTGYVGKIRDRLWEMQHATEKATGEHGALVLYNREGIINDLLWELFPNLRPHPESCDCDACHARKCRNARCNRSICVAARKPIRWRSYQERKVDLNAQRRGGAVASTADLSGRDNRVGPNRDKELG